MFGRNTPPRQEQSHYSQRGPERQGYEYEIDDEEYHHQANNRGQPKGHISGSSSRKHPSGRSSNPPPPSGRRGESPGHSGVSAGGGRDPKYDDGFRGSHKASSWIPTPRSMLGYLSPNTNDRRDDVPQKPSRQQLNCEIESLQKSNRILQDQIQDLKSECGRLKNRVETMQSARDAQESNLGRQEQDDSIRQQFNNVFQPIRNWSAKFCMDASQPVDVRGISPAVTRLIQRVLPGMRSLDELPDFLPVGDKKRRRMFIRGWVALNVSLRISQDFDHEEFETDLWLPKKERDAIRSLESKFIPSGEEINQSSYHEWRALTFTLLDKTFRSHPWAQDSTETLNDAVRRTLEVIMHMALPTADLSELEHSLCENVFVPAVELSQVLRRQRAHWYSRFPHITSANIPLAEEYIEAYPFQPDQMRDVDSPEEDEDECRQDPCFKAVEIIIRPGLFKCGNNDGEQYEVESVVEKAQVSCTKIMYEGEGPLV